MEENNNFSTRLKELRAQKKESQQEASEAIGIHINTLKNYEKGTRLPNANELIKIKNHYNTSYEYLLGESDIKSNDMNLKEINKVTGLSEKAIKILKGPLINKSQKKILSYIIEHESKYQFIKILELFLMTKVEDKFIYKKLSNYVYDNPPERLKFINRSSVMTDILKCDIDRILYKMEDDIIKANEKEKK